MIHEKPSREFQNHLIEATAAAKRAGCAMCDTEYRATVDIEGTRYGCNITGNYASNTNSLGIIITNCDTGAQTVIYNVMLKCRATGAGISNKATGISLRAEDDQRAIDAFCEAVMYRQAALDNRRAEAQAARARLLDAGLLAGGMA